MKYLIPVAFALSLTPALASAQAKPLVVANDAWRSSALSDLAPLLRPCLPRPDQVAPARLPLAKGATDDLETTVVLQEPSTIGRGYWYRIGWRARDGAVYIVAARSPDGQRVVYGPVGGDWACLPADVRKELGGR